MPQVWQHRTHSMCRNTTRPVADPLRCSDSAAMAAEGDLEWEDAAADDWEVLIEGDDDTQAAAGASRDVVVELDVGGCLLTCLHTRTRALRARHACQQSPSLPLPATDTGQGKKRVQRVVITKEKRLQCQALHRVHVLCLLARLKLHDEAASGAELQVRAASKQQHTPTLNFTGCSHKPWCCCSCTCCAVAGAHPVHVATPAPAHI